MYPERAVLHMALGEAQWITKYEEGTYDFWVSLNHVYNLDMSLLADHAVARYKGGLWHYYCTGIRKEVCIYDETSYNNCL